jgi:predicted metal-dependent hydrolase
MTLDARLAPGRAAFNRGEFFAAHELWEDVWRGLASMDDGRLLVQGLIQIAAGLHHLQRGRTRPAARLLVRGANKLARAPATELPIAALVRDVTALRAALEAPSAGAPDPAVIRL